MTKTEFQELKEALMRKQFTKMRLKPAEEGFNEGLDCAISVCERMIGKGYQTTKAELLKQRITGQCSNREAGFNDAILRTASKLREIHLRNHTE